MWLLFKYQKYLPPVLFLSTLLYPIYCNAMHWPETRSACVMMWGVTTRRIKGTRLLLEPEPKQQRQGQVETHRTPQTRQCTESCDKKMLQFGGRVRGVPALVSLILVALAAASSDLFDNQLGDINYCKKQCQMSIKNKSPAKVSATYQMLLQYIL